MLGRKQVLLIGILTITLLLMSSTALAGKGIVKGISGGGTGGTLIVSDPGVETGTPVPRTDTGVFPGRELNFSGTGILVLGDLVEFDYDVASDSGINARKIGSGVIITGTRDQKVEATATNHVLMIDAHVNAKVTSNTGTVIIIGNSIIDGKVDIDNGATLIIVKTASGAPKVNGKIDSLNKNILFIRGCEVEGKVTSSLDSYVEITQCTISGKLELLSKPVNGCNVSDNTVSGTVDIPNSCQQP